MSYHAFEVAALVLFAFIAPAMADDYEVRWRVIEHDVTPQPQTASQGYVARFSYDGARFVTDVDGRRAETVPGQAASFVTKLGTRNAITYDVRGRSIVRTDVFPGFSSVMVIMRGGAGGCRVSIEYRKAAGEARFESKRYDGSGPSTATRVEARDARCTVSAPQS